MMPDIQEDSRHRSDDLRVLIVDDDDVDTERLSRLLRHYPRHMEIDEAISKADVHKRLDTEDLGYSFVFLDFHLSDGDGRDLVPEIRARFGSACVIVAVTSARGERVAADAIKSGINEYLPKLELSLPKILDTIENGLKWRRLQENLRRAEMELQRRSMYDALTDLPNRSLFFDRLEQACANYTRKPSPFAVLMIDLDRFKEVNDTMGHAVGDQLLKEIASRFAAQVRCTDTVARLGGDEFAAMLPDIPSIGNAEAVARKILDCLTVPIWIAGRRLSVGASIGIAMCPQHGQEPRNLLGQADQAMYRAKRGLDKIVKADGHREESGHLQNTQAVIAELSLALERDEVEWHFQPKVQLSTMEVTGFEALARWNHPLRGHIGPECFMPVVERSAFLPTFTLKSFAFVFARLSEWKSTGVDLNVAVNVSARMLEYDPFLPSLQDHMSRFQIDPGKLTLELTETALIANPGQVRKVVDRLASLGVELSVDDFGAGFTAFGYLREFLVPEIKIDKSYITDLRPGTFNASFVQSLGVLCKALGIRLVAEGVESHDLLPLLVTLGCDQGQGHAIARPMPAHDVLTWLSRHAKQETTPAEFWGAGGNGPASKAVPHESARQAASTVRGRRKRAKAGTH